MENILIFETLRGYFIFGDQKKFKNSYIYSRAVAHIFINFFLVWHFAQHVLGFPKPKHCSFTYGCI